MQKDEYGTNGDSALGSALIGSLAALVGETLVLSIGGLLTSCQAGRGGQVVAFTSSLPNIGLGSLKPRDDESTLYDTDKESTLYKPREDTWEDIAEQCSEAGIGISMFLGMYKPIDIGSIGL